MQRIGLARPPKCFDSHLGNRYLPYLNDYELFAYWTIQTYRLRYAARVGIVAPSDYAPAANPVCYGVERGAMYCRLGMGNPLKISYETT